MDKEKLRCVLISDFNLDVFSGYLNNDETLPAVDTTAAPFGQVMPILMQENLEYWKGGFDFTVIWTRPEAVIKSFDKLLSSKPQLIQDILDEVDQFVSLLLKICDKIKTVFIPTWVLPPYVRGLGMLDMKKDIGIANVLMQMNLRLSERIEQTSNIYLIDAQKWTSAAGKYAFNPRLWYRGKIVFGNDVYKEAVKDIKSALRGIQGNARKLVVLDLDNTLWGGVVGDLGREYLVLGGHDPSGEAFADFQLGLKALSNRGILLGIVSKNEESTALDAIKNHPEMVLDIKDFAGWRINWQDKAQNIVDLVSDLNLGLQSVVFIDDNPVERARVREALSEVFVPDWPQDPMLFKSTLSGLRCFDTPSISKEDMERTRMYLSEKQRTDMKKSVGSLDEWLKGLEMKVRIEEVNNMNIQRTAQLFNKTNQMNLTTRRMTEPELLDWASREGRKVWTFRVSDKFGDAGLTGIISLEAANGAGRISDFILSCRVIGRKIEETMLYTVIQYARDLGLDTIMAEYKMTPKNKPCLDYWKKSGFHYDEKASVFTWDLKNEYELPDCIEISRE